MGSGRYSSQCGAIMGEAEKAPKPRLRWYQYRLAHLFVFVTICAIPRSWFACKMAAAKRQKEAVKVFTDRDVVIGYDFEFDANFAWLPSPQPPGPAWFRNLVGIDFLADVVVAYTRPPLEEQGQLPVTDWNLRYIERFAKLGRLDLEDAEVTDDGLEHLKGMTKLKMLNLRGTQVTDEGINQLQQALPNCEIEY